jgi:hypothetical protein
MRSPPQWACDNCAMPAVIVSRSDALSPWNPRRRGEVCATPAHVLSIKENARV